MTYTITSTLFENLTLTGSAAINGTGNSAANTIIGNSGANFLAGGGGDDTLTGDAGADTIDGGTGADAMIGGVGNDIYVVDNVGDTLDETSGGGSDTVQVSLAAFTLTSGFENLILVGTGNSSGTGSNSANSLMGNSGANLLNGGGGTIPLKELRATTL
nr:hypothetical protein [Oleomonas cavernae]